MAEQLHTFLRLKQVKEFVGLSKSSIYEFIKRGEFPAPVAIGPRAVAWPLNAIADWQAQQLQRRVTDESKREHEDG
jgi:prophage regulatory protein